MSWFYWKCFLCFECIFSMSIIFRYFCLLDFIFIYNILKISFLSNYVCFHWKILLLLSCLQVQLFCLFFNEFYWLGFLWKFFGRTICLFIYFQHFLHLVLTSVFYLAFCVLLEFLQNFILFFGLWIYLYLFWIICLGFYLSLTRGNSETNHFGEIFWPWFSLFLYYYVGTSALWFTSLLGFFF